MPVQYQVASLFALTHGYLDSVAIDDIADFEAGLNDYLDSNDPDDLNVIKTTGKLPEGDTFENAVKAFANGFTASTDAK